MISSKAKAYLIGVGLGEAALPKTLYRMNSPFLGITSILMWF